VFGVQKIVNLACGSFYALGAYFGVTFIVYATEIGLSAWFIFPRSHPRRIGSGRDRAAAGRAPR
jgi:branched-subunit amino acid ABC-type transport system permease component